MVTVFLSSKVPQMTVRANDDEMYYEELDIQFSRQPTFIPGTQLVHDCCFPKFYGSDQLKSPLAVLILSMKHQMP